MPGGIVKINAAPAVIIVYFANLLPARVGSVLQSALADTGETRVEFLIADEKRIMLAEKLDARFAEMQRDMVGNVERKEESGFTGRRKPQNIGEEVRGLPFVTREDQQMIKLDGQEIFQRGKVEGNQKWRTPSRRFHYSEGR